MFVLKLISRLPLSALYVFSDFLFATAYYLVGYREKVVWQNLSNSFPEMRGKDLKIVQKKFYKNLFDYAVETIKLQTITQQELSNRMVFKNPEILQSFADASQSVIMLSSHQFNWE